MVRNERIQEQTNEEKVELSVHERRLRWLRHVQRTSDDKIAEQVLHWNPEERRRRGRTRVTWQHMISKDTEKGGIVPANVLVTGRAKVDRKDNCTIDSIAPAVLSDSCKHAIFVPMRKKCGTDFRNSDYKIGNFFPAVELSMPTGLSSLSSCVFVANGGTSWHVCSSACVFLHVGVFFFSFACH